MARSQRFLALLVLTLLGDLACTPCRCPPPAGPVSPAAAVSAAASRQGPPLPAVEASPRVPSGLYHLRHIDAMNLALDVQAGTFRLGVNGCDYSHATQGFARAEGDGVVLSGDFTWPEDPSFANAVESVVLRPGPAGTLRATGVIGGRPFDQEWLPGGVCPDCGGLGPTGQGACDRPYLGP